MNTNEYKTKTIMQPRQNPSSKNYWGEAIDIGFSSVKIISPNQIACFPSYARKLPKGQRFLGEADKKTILYRDATGDTWLVGMYAQNMVHADDFDSLNAGLFIKNRFESPMFKVIARTGLALGMMKNAYGDPTGKTLAVQTGLPTEHIGEFSDDLKHALAGEHSFEIKIGEGNWQQIHFVLPFENVQVMEQPLGSLIAISTDRNGGPVPNAKKYLNSNVLVIDPGFGTVDTFNISERRIVGSKTWEDLGMNAVLNDACEAIEAEYKTKVTVPSIQKSLENGTIRVTNRKERKSYNQPFGDILERVSKNKCKELLATIDETYQGLMYHDYLIVTGGLGAAWFKQIENYYAGMETLTVIPGTLNDNIDGIFSNVRGYYMNLLNSLR